MANQADLKNWIIEALEFHGGKAYIIDVHKYVWQVYEPELRKSGDLFFRWQYDLRWAATELRREGKLRRNTRTRGLWRLVK